MNGNVEAGPKTYLNNDKLSEDTINQKMLSLHIGVVENEPYPAASNSFGKSEKRVDLKRFAIRNSFEFRRQQNDKAKESEISHFKASQKLIFDDPLPQSTRSSSEGEESEDESDEPVNFFNHSDGDRE
uniref:Uncharacterized protein n=1 Tax=Panagrolaimus sp. PS1159 TaxID=55785 RepID=A0AC35F6F9_9BILA